MTDLQRIIYVEDDEDLRDAVHHILADLEGFELLSFEDGETAVKRAVEFRPQLAILDVRLPGMSGPETLVHLRQLEGLQSLDAIFITTLAEPKHRELYEKLGSLALIPKPIDFSLLANTIRRLWKDKRAA
ncbi:MAG: response regulator [Magnetovibrionaceae bacterium]